MSRRAALVGAVRTWILAWAICGLLVGPVSAGPPQRGVYWNFSARTTFDKPLSERIDWLKRASVSQVHLVLNDTTRTVDCAGVFAYNKWTAEQVRTFTQALQAEGIGVTWMIHLGGPNSAFIGSLSGVLQEARSLPGVNLEFDAEGQWQEVKNDYDAVCGSVDRSALVRSLVKKVRDEAPGARLGVNTTPGYLDEHPLLIALADWVSPQLYDKDRIESNIGMTLARAAARDIRPIVPAHLGVDALRDSIVVVERIAANGALAIPEYVIWSRAAFDAPEQVVLKCKLGVLAKAADAC